MKKNTKLKRAKIICSAIILSSTVIASSAQAAKAAGLGTRVRNVGASVTSGIRGIGDFFSGLGTRVSRWTSGLTSCFGRGNTTSGGYTVEGTVGPDGTVYSTIKLKNNGGGPNSVLPKDAVLIEEVIYTTVKKTNSGNNGSSSGRQNRLSTFSTDSGGSTSPYAVVDSNGKINAPSKNPTSGSTSGNNGPTYENLGYHGHSSTGDPTYADINATNKTPKPTVTSTTTSSTTSSTSPTKTPPPVAPKPKLNTTGTSTSTTTTTSTSTSTSSSTTSSSSSGNQTKTPPATPPKPTKPTPPLRTTSLGPNSIPIKNKDGNGNTTGTKLTPITESGTSQTKLTQTKF
ncbi:hypothetical protein [Candidatus Arthromitus sp. SFB-rat-Yit]|uniref:hypothetical protein n=1 Tax=Candidatus Arthromitus sp. SFB-rat-Yit TaxID=1041504 RepID=UPI000227A311|nr:hypothetical protein [Candidatus Arthromitus sp. SFB-rat-Yit]BAK81451.1 hypothetical protein RATSFB_0889 [Candidatus Arthromitus sp. SFB-rat-Yit]